VAVVAGGERLQPGGHRGELDVGEPLEGLAHVGEAVTVTDGQVVVREPAPAPARAAVGGDDDAVDRLRDLQLEPALAAPAGLVGAAEVLRHHALVTRGERPREERAPGVGGTSGSRGDQTETRAPSWWSWMRAPSYLYSSAVRPPCATSTSSTSRAISASIGRSGTPGRAAVRASAAAPPRSARSATVARS